MYFVFCWKCVGLFMFFVNQKMQEMGFVIYFFYLRGLKCLIICKSYSEDSECFFGYFKIQVWFGFFKLKLYSIVEIYF